MTDGIRRSKLATRQLALARRNILTPTKREGYSRLIAGHLDAEVLGALPSGAVVGMYADKAGEVETARMVEALMARGLRVAFPRVHHGTRVLTFHAAAAADLVAGTFGLREPAETSPRLELGDLAALVVPGVAFDRHGGRIGWGGGYYDATLAQCPHAVRIGVAYSCQIVDSVRRADHDVAMHWLITEQGAARCAP